MHSKAKGPTKAEKKRMEKIVELGCVCCRMRLPRKDSHNIGPGECHHLLDGGVRRGHAFTICLCAFHHRGDDGGWGKDYAIQFKGQSLAYDARAFHEEFGTDDELLEYQNTLLKAAGFVLPTSPNLSSGECHGDDA